MFFLVVRFLQDATFSRTDDRVCGEHQSWLALRLVIDRLFVYIQGFLLSRFEYVFEWCERLALIFWKCGRDNFKIVQTNLFSHALLFAPFSFVSSLIELELHIPVLGVVCGAAKQMRALLFCLESCLRRVGREGEVFAAVSGDHCCLARAAMHRRKTAERLEVFVSPTSGRCLLIHGSLALMYGSR